MSDSDSDDMPLAKRRAPAPSAAQPEPIKPAVKEEPSDSDDDLPIARRAAPAAASQRQPAAKDQPAPKVPAVKAEPDATSEKPKQQAASKPAIKQENGAAPAVKKEPESSKPAIAAAKKAVKKETGKEGGKAVKKEEGAADVKVKKEKKEYDMPGQTRDTPPETDPLRKFYTSLLEQIPTSDMAKKWCLQHGLLSQEDAEDYLAKTKGAAAVAKSPAKPSRPSANGSKSAAEKRRASDKPRAAPAKKTKRDVAFADGGLGSSDDESDDDKPLAAKKPAAKAALPRPSAPKPAAAKAAPPKPEAPKPPPKRVLCDFSDSDDDDLPLAQRSKQAAAVAAP